MKNVLFILMLLVIAMMNSACKIDPCKDIDCQNGGICDKGDCICQNGYTGERCQTKIDPCANISCQNGGYCGDGSCHCPQGYSGIYCETYNPCAGINCQNGGTCVSGACNCPPGYYGTYCEYHQTATGLMVTRIVITDFPQTLGGNCWDYYTSEGPGGCHPDIFLTLEFGSPLYTYSTGHYEDCVNTNNYSYDINSSFWCGVNTDINLDLHDYDINTGNDAMGNGTFNLGSYANTCPAKVSFTGANRKYDVYVTWTY